MLVLSLGLMASTSLALAPWVMADDMTPEVAADVQVDQVDVYDTIATHPSVQAYRSQVCQASSQIDLAEADLLPQISGRLVGGSSLSSHIERAQQIAFREK